MCGCDLERWVMRRSTAVLCTLLLVAACREGDGPADPSLTDARVYLTSSPNGAQITVDNRSTGHVTPDTVSLRRGDRAMVLRLDSAGFTYDFDFTLQVEPGDDVPEVHVPLGVQCVTPDGTCFQGARRHYEAAGLRFAASAVGSLFHWGGSGSGLFWPAATSNSYASSGMPVFAGIANGDSLSLGMYDQLMLAGRPAPRTTTADGAFRLEQHSWILPPRTQLVRPSTVRGILIEEEVIGRDDLQGVLIVRLTFRNVSHDPLVHTFAAHIPPAPVTYTDAWIGLALDPDIATAGDDWLSYDPDINLVYAYDADFLAPFAGSDAGQPGLIGLSVLEAPAGTDVMLNSWYVDFDWNAGRPGEQAGYGMLSGTAVFAPEHEHPEIGYMPPSMGDVRIAVTAGPLTLAPGEEAGIVIAVAVASPVAGTFTSGVTVQPGDPLDTTRTIHRVAANLRAQVAAARDMPQ